MCLNCVVSCPKFSRKEALEGWLRGGESGGGQASLAGGGGAPGRQRDHSGLDPMPPREMLQETSLRCWGGGFPWGGELPS